MATFDFRRELERGLAIPAHPLALDRNRKFDERHQRGLTRYYLAAGVGGLAVGVHTTQFAIREPRHGLYQPVLELAAEEMKQAEQPVVAIAGICGTTNQAVQEARLAADLGYHAGLLSLSALATATEVQLIEHCRAVSQVIPIAGFYLQPAVGGRILPFSFWNRFAQIENVVAIKIAPFNRYQTLDVVRAVAESGRADLPLYTGNDDNIVADLVTRFTFNRQTLRIVGGLLGHWSVATRIAVQLLDRCQREAAAPCQLAELLQTGVEVTDCNAAFFDAPNQFRGCIAGLHEVLFRQGLLDSIHCLDEHETLGAGQREQIDRVLRCYPHLTDDDFIEQHRDRWLA